MKRDEIERLVAAIKEVLSDAIREGGTGEIVYSQEGTRRSAGARSDAGGAIARGCEVVVTRYEKGLAYVREWKDMVTE